MVGQDMVDLARQRMIETEAAIEEQRRYIEGLGDPSLRAIAARTLATLEDMLLIMRRTHGMLVATTSGGAFDGSGFRPDRVTYAWA